MGVTSREGLDIAILIYYTPVLVLSIGLGVRHGFRRAEGWFFLITLSLLRLIGGSTGIAAVHYPTNSSLVACSLVTFGIGLSPLLLLTAALLRRASTNTSFGAGNSKTNSHLWRVLSLPIIVGLVLGAIAGSDVFSSDPSTVNLGYELQEASSILYLAAYLALVAIAVVFARQLPSGQADAGERRVLTAVTLSLPFLLVRVIYSVIVAFEKGRSDVFSTYDPSWKAVVTQGVMSVAMEFIVVAIYIFAGYHLERAAKKGQHSRNGQLESGEGYKQEMGAARY